MVTGIDLYVLSYKLCGATPAHHRIPHEISGTHFASPSQSLPLPKVNPGAATASKPHGRRICATLKFRVPTLHYVLYCRTLLSRWVASPKAAVAFSPSTDANAQRHRHHRVLLTLPILPHWMTTFRQRCWKMQWYNQLPRCWYIQINIPISTLLTYLLFAKCP